MTSADGEAFGQARWALRERPAGVVKFWNDAAPCSPLGPKLLSQRRSVQRGGSVDILVIGRSGQVATALVERAGPHRVVALGRPEADLTDPDSLVAALAAVRPDAVFNAAAYTAVDAAEADEAAAHALNADGPGALARLCAERDVPLIHLSTDYVFDGTLDRPYREDDTTGPTSAYGRTKLAGERAVTAAGGRALIARTAWVYAPFGRNFVRTMLRLGAERDVMRVVADQRGNPTSALDIADALVAIAAANDWPATPEVVHLAGSGETTWHGFATAIFAASPYRPRVDPVATADYPTPARRPANSRLDCHPPRPRTTASRCRRGATASPQRSRASPAEPARREPSGCKRKNGTARGGPVSWSKVMLGPNGGRPDPTLEQCRILRPVPQNAEEILNRCSVTATRAAPKGPGDGAQWVERAMGIEPTTSSLGSLRSTTELHPHGSGQGTAARALSSDAVPTRRRAFPALGGKLGRPTACARTGRPLAGTRRSVHPGSPGATRAFPDGGPRMTAPKMDGPAWAMMLALAALWGASFVLTEIILPQVPVLTTVAARLAIAAVTLRVVLAAMGVSVPTSPRLWTAFLVLGIFANAIPFCLIVWGQTHLTGGLAAVLNATTPLFTGILAGIVLPDERLTPHKLLGLLLGLGGVVVVIGPTAAGSLGGES